jgi:hypothetical protein
MHHGLELRPGDTLELSFGVKNGPRPLTFEITENSITASDPDGVAVMKWDRKPEAAIIVIKIDEITDFTQN